MKAFVAAAPLAALFQIGLQFGCTTYIPPAVRYSVRTEAWSPDRAAWAHEHCQLIEAISMERWGLDARVSHANYMLAVDEAPGDVKVLAYVCPIAPTWPRADAEIVRGYYAEAHLPGKEDMTRCAARDAEGPSDKELAVEIVAPGQGQAVTADSFVEVRARRVVAGDDPSGGEPPRTYVSHVQCLPFAPAVVRLKVGGKARMNLVSDKLGRKWEIELVSVGEEDMFKKSLGL